MAVTSIDRLLVSRRSGDLLPLVSPTTQVGAGSSSGSATVSLGFTFTFAGSSYTSVFVRASGYLRFAGTVDTGVNASLATVDTNAIACPWWDALKTADTTGYVKTELQGTAPFRRMVIEWACYLSSGHTATDHDAVTFQAILYETIDAIDFRYGSRTRTGSPGTSYSATAGVKADTTSIAANFVDLGVTADRSLGGSSTSSSTTLALADYDARVGTVTRIEPAWPMCGRLHLLDDSDLSGLQDPWGEPAWKIANAVNWLWCHHCPSPVSFAPQEQTERTSVIYAVPMRLSADTDVTYEATLQVYATTVATLTVTLSVPAVAQPDPNVGGDWTTLASGTPAVVSGWQQVQVTGIPTDAAEVLRVSCSMSAGNVLVGHFLLVPERASSFDIKTSYASGWLPQGLGQIRLEGAPVHPEWFNRAWRSIAAVLADRAQVVWSSAWPHHSVYEIATTTAKPQRTLGVSPASLRGWKGQACTLRTFARDSVGGAQLWFAELGGRSVEVSVVDDKHRSVDTPFDLIGDTPTLMLTARPEGDLSVVGAVLEWAPALSQDDLIEGVTPAPRLEYLFALANRIERTLTAYAMPGLCGLFARGKYSTNRWHVTYAIPPATKSLRPKMARVAVDQNTTAEDTSLFGATSGSGAQDEVVIPSPHTQGVDDFPPEGPLAVAAGSEVWEPTPTAAQDRLLESPTATAMDGAQLEQVELLRGVGFTMVPNPANPAAL